VETYIESGEIRLWTTADGSGVPVLLISGGPGCCDYLEPVAALIDGAQTIRFDARGCGRSSLSPCYTLSHSLADLEAIRRHYGIEHWIVLGHSAGADLALAYAVQHPNRAAAIACLSGGRIHNDRDWHAVYVEGRDAGREAPLDYAYPYNPDVNAQLNAEWHAYTRHPGLLRELANLATPALFVYGSDDIRPSWPIEQVAHLLPNAHWRLLPGAGHNLWLSHAESLRQLLNGFLSEIAPSL
jgi:proline iminopeptidase